MTCNHAELLNGACYLCLPEMFPTPARVRSYELWFEMYRAKQAKPRYRPDSKALRDEMRAARPKLMRTEYRDMLTKVREQLEARR